MIIKPQISQSSNILSNLADALKIVSEIRINQNVDSLLDLSEVYNTSPLFILPIFLELNESKGNLRVQSSENLKNISFPGGLDCARYRQVLLKAKLRETSNKGNFPLCLFPASSDFEDETSSVISIVENEVFEKLQLCDNIKNGLRYIIGEIVDNITQHSKCEKGIIYARYDKANNELEVAIADQGIGLFGSYKNSRDIDIISDIEALQAANRGISTKNLPNAENRGFGIITSKRMITDGLNGLFIMISGSAALIKTKDFNKYLDIPTNMNFKGTIVMFKINLTSNNFNYINFVE